ncbi:MAG: PAC2 family protein, partial [Halorhabdus sp.]
MARDPSFDVRLTTDSEPGETLLIGLAGQGVAGLTAADYLITHVETTQIGHVETRNLPDITPFSEGKPRNPIRLYSTADSSVTILISELFMPVWVADPFADA